MAKSISVAVADSDTMLTGRSSIVTDPFMSSTVTGNPSSRVVVVVGCAVVVLAIVEVVSPVVATVSPPKPQAARTRINARSGVVLLI
jgi:hypothetical protein